MNASQLRHATSHVPARAGVVLDIRRDDGTIERIAIPNWHAEYHEITPENVKKISRWPVFLVLNGRTVSVRRDGEKADPPERTSHERTGAELPNPAATAAEGV